MEDTLTSKHEIWNLHPRIEPIIIDHPDTVEPGHLSDDDSGYDGGVSLDSGDGDGSSSGSDGGTVRASWTDIEGDDSGNEVDIEAMTDEEERSPAAPSPALSEDTSNQNQAIQYQNPSPVLTEFFSEAMSQCD